MKGLLNTRIAHACGVSFFPHEPPVEGEFGKLISNWPIGIEIEAENAIIDSACANELDLYGWSIVGDGSLRDSGIEFLFNSAAGGKQASDRIKYITSLRRKHKWRSSRRTSTHVHLNMCHLTVQDLANILCVYALIEPALFTYVGREREENIYCVPMYRADQTDVGYMSGLYRNIYDRQKEGLEFPSLRDKMVHGNKYSALNFSTLSRFGTIEFRQAPMYTGAELYRWVNLILALAHFSLQHENAEAIVSLYRDLGAIGFTKLAFGGEYGSLKIRDLNITTGMKLQDFNDYIDVVSVAERVGGIVSSNRGDVIGGGWVIGKHKKVIHRRAKKKSGSRSNGGIRFRNSLLDTEPQG